VNLSLSINKDATGPRPCWWCRSIKTSLFVARAFQKPTARPFVDMEPCALCKDFHGAGFTVVAEVSDEGFKKYSEIEMKERLYWGPERLLGTILLVADPVSPSALGFQGNPPTRELMMLPAEFYRRFQLIEHSIDPGSAMSVQSRLDPEKVGSLQSRHSFLILLDKGSNPMFGSRINPDGDVGIPKMYVRNK